MDAWDDFGISRPPATTSYTDVHPGSVTATAQDGGAYVAQGLTTGGLQCWRPGYTRVRKGIVDQWEQLYNDPSLKDVEVMLNDSTVVMADSLVLKVASPVFREQLNLQCGSSPLAQELEEVTNVLIKEAEDEPCVLPRSSPSAPSDGCLRVTVNAASPEFRFFLRLLYTGRMDPSEWPVEEPCHEHEQLPMLPGSLVSQPPATTEPVLPLDGRHHLAGPMPGPPLAHTPDLHVPEGGFFQQGAIKGKGKGAFRRAPSITLLLGAASLARAYKVDWLLHVLIEVMKERITEVSFDSILCGAVAYDIAPLRLAALDFARRSCEVWRRYSQREYSPEVLFELQALYPAPMAGFGLSDSSDIMGI